MQRIIIAIVVAALLIGGGYYLSERQRAQENQNNESMMSASFSCADQTSYVAEFPDGESVRIVVAGEVVRTLPRIEGDGQRFEDDAYVYVFAGEEATVINKATGASATCTQPFDANNAPMNFGDAAEGGGAQPDLSVVVNESIVGTWQSDEDGKFVRVFNSDGTTADLYEGAETSKGTWRTFTSEATAAVGFPLEANTVYVEITEPGTESLYFKLAALTPERLELIYMNRGGVLVFTRVN